MTRFTSLLATTALIAAASSAQAVSFSFQTIDNPGDPTFNQLLGINNTGVIAGYFGSGAAGHPNKGYTTAAPYSTFVPDNLPGSTQTQATGINDSGVTTGFWSPTNVGGDANFGFIKVPNASGASSYLSVNDPNVTSSPVINQVLGINNKDNAVGFYNDATGASHAFAYLVSTAKYTEITRAGAVSVAATGINNSNLISGFLVNKFGRTLGFLKPETGGNGIVFSVPGASVTQLLGVNNTGHAVGFFMKPGGVPQGLYLDPATLNWLPVNDPKGTMGTVLNGLNDNNQIVGFYTGAAGNTHGVLVTVSP